MTWTSLIVFLLGLCAGVCCGYLLGRAFTLHNNRYAVRLAQRHIRSLLKALPANASDQLHRPTLGEAAESADRYLAQEGIPEDAENC